MRRFRLADLLRTFAYYRAALFFGRATHTLLSIITRAVKEEERTELLRRLTLLPFSQNKPPHAQFTESPPISSPLFGSGYAGSSKDTRLVFSEGISSDCAYHRSWLRPIVFKQKKKKNLNIVSGKIVISVFRAVPVLSLASERAVCTDGL